MTLSLQKKFAIFGVGPLLLLAMAGTAAFTFGQDINTITATQERTDYLIPATQANTLVDEYVAKTNGAGECAIDTTETDGSRTGASGTCSYTTTNTPKYGEMPQWFQVDTGAGAVPTGIQEPGDLLFINAASTTTGSARNNTQGGANNVNAVQAIFVQGNISNIPALRQTYASCLIPIRLWSSLDNGGTWTDVTHTYLDTQVITGSNYEPYYIDCTTGTFSFEVPTGAAANGAADDLQYEVSIERGGVFSTMNNNIGAVPEFVFQSTPIALVSKTPATVTAASPTAITAGDTYPTITYTTSPSPITWITEPTCGIYASNDTAYASPLTGVSTAGTYVTHCAGGTSTNFTPTHTDGSLTVDSRVPTITQLPNWQGLEYGGGQNTAWSPNHPILWILYNQMYAWITPATAAGYLSEGTVQPDGSVAFFTDYKFYYSPDGVIYTDFPT